LLVVARGDALQDVVQGDEGIDCVLLFGEGEGERRERESFGGKRFVS
jgi:hypothetical protein